MVEEDVQPTFAPDFDFPSISNGKGASWRTPGSDVEACGESSDLTRAIEGIVVSE